MSKSRSGAPRRVAAGLLAGALTVVGFALAPPAGATDTVTSDRVAGINRYGTAAAVAGQTDFDGATMAILATGETFPDALAASGLAGSNGPAPIILTQSKTYSSEAQEALNNLTSVTDVTIVGGTAAISQGVQDAVEADGFTVTRVAGANRYETAAAIANEMGTVGQVGGLDTALIATGNGFADALAGGPVSYDGNLPILLVTPDSVPAATESALNDLGIKQVVILGGTAAVSDATQASLEDIVGNPAIRVAGVNRFATAAAVGEFAIDNLGWTPTTVLLASGLNFPDALAAGPLGGERQAPVLLTASMPDETQAFLDAHSDVITALLALGGTGVIDAATLQAAVDAAQTTSNDNPVPTNATATTRPELVSATIVETRTTASAQATAPPGTYVKYCFDEAITGAAIDATKAHVYNSDGGRFSGSASSAPSGQSFTSSVTSDNNKCMEVIYPALATAASAANITLATVERGAATGSTGATLDTNIEGDAPLTPAAASAAAAGVTVAPDLLSVGNFRAGSTNDVTAVDFTFDEAAYTQSAGALGYHLVSTGGADYTCIASTSTSDPSGQALPGGSGTTVHTVACQEPAALTGSAHLDPANIARGYVVAGGVMDASSGGNLNPLEAADVSNSGNSDGPDLSLIIFAPDALVNSDIVAFVYDEAVLAGTNPSGLGAGTYAFGGHKIYNTAGVENGSAVCSRSSDNNSVVTCGFADNTLANSTYVGGNVRANQVFDVDSSTGNQPDEVGVSPSAGPSTTTGKTDGPDLTGVAINTATNAFGNTVYSATYTFDEDTNDVASQATTTDDTAGTAVGTSDTRLPLFHLYNADGTRLDCVSVTGIPTSDSATLANRDEATDNTVTCGQYAVGGTGGSGGNTITPIATGAQVHNSVVGTVEYGAVDDEAGADGNPEGAEIATGSAGTAAS